MKQITARPAEPRDTDAFLEYEIANKGNEFDPEAGLYPSSFTLCTETEHEPIVFLPVQRPFLLESVGTRPGTDKKDVAYSLRLLEKMLVDLARQAGIGELMFVATEPTIEALASKHNWEKLPYPVYRLRVKDYQ